VRYVAGEAQLRPGGTISGPTMMGRADTVMYALVLSAIGKVPLAVTTNLSINFLRKPELKPLVADGRMLKLGKTLAVGDVIIRSEGRDEPVAHAVVTYSIPPR
jgi:acyl-coenzyme A thioesterase PaaI-like protein